MVILAHAIVRRVTALAGITLGMVGLAGLAALGEEAGSASSTVKGGGVTLHSVSVELPVGNRTFPGGARADAINNNCLACHSAGMVLTQPALSREEWQDEVNKTRNIFRAPVAQEDVPKIVEYLVNLSAERTRASHR